VDDIRESPAIEILHELVERGARVDYIDPRVPELTLPDGSMLRSIDDPLDAGTDLVIVDVPVDRVYAAVKTQVSTAKGIMVTRDEPAAHRIEFTNGTQIAGIQAVSLGENLTQLMVSSAHSNAPASPTSMIVQHIVATCKAMNIECSRGS